MAYLLSDYQLQVQELVHDLNSVDFSSAELTRYINNARKRTSLDMHCTRSFNTGGNLIASQEQYQFTGSVPSVTITAGGSGYSSAPTVTFAAAPSGGTTATGTAVLTSGVVTSITMTNWGKGYTSAPAITFGSGAATATANALLSVFDILSISVLWPGSSTRATLGWMPFTPFQAFCRANTTSTRTPAVWTTIDESNTLFFYPVPDQAYTVELDVLRLPADLVNLTDADTDIAFPNDDIVQYYAAHLALLKLQNFEHADYMFKKYKARATDIKSTRQDRRQPNVYRNWSRRLNRW